MDFKQFEREVLDLVKLAPRNDLTIHLRKSQSGHYSVICGAVSWDHAPRGAYISRPCFTVRLAKERRIDLEEYFKHMMEDIKEQEEFERLGKESV